MSQLLFETLLGEEAAAWLDKPGNEKAWERLYLECPWRFPTLSPAYNRLWFKHYGTLWQPLLVLATDTEGTLKAVFPLAVGEHLITGVGANQAEYHGWLSGNEDASCFLSSGLLAVTQRLAGHHIRLRYLAPGIPTQAVTAYCQRHSRGIFNIHSRPLLQLDKELIAGTLKKKSNRSKINRLKRKGTLRFFRLGQTGDIAQTLDSIIRLYDFRQGATNDSCPFHDDPAKRTFLLDWAKQAAGDTLHITCMTLNDELIAAHIGVVSNNEAQLAILAYSPLYGPFSPGKLQIYQAANMMAEEGLSQFDLTAGGDPWKERFATNHDSVLSLDVYPRSAIAARIRLLTRLDAAGRSILRSLGISPAQVKRTLHWLEKLHPSRLAREFLTKPVQCYAYQLKRYDTSRSFPGASVHRNTLEDLIAYEPQEKGADRQAFLANALARLESGSNIYSIADDDRLICYACLSLNQDKTFVNEVMQNIHYPEPGMVIHDFYVHPQHHGDPAAAAMVQKILSDIKVESTMAVYLNITSSSRPNDKWIAALGFELRGIARVSPRLWRRQHGLALSFMDDHG